MSYFPYFGGGAAYTLRIHLINMFPSYGLSKNDLEGPVPRLPNPAQDCPAASVAPALKVPETCHV